MSREDRELLTHLAQVNGQVPGLALRLMNGELPVDEQREFARQLTHVADALLAHADRRNRTVLDHEPRCWQPHHDRVGSPAP